MSAPLIRHLEAAYIGRNSRAVAYALDAWGVSALESALATMRHCPQGTPAPCDGMIWEPMTSAIDAYGTGGIFGRWTTARLIALRDESFANVAESHWD